MIAHLNGTVAGVGLDGAVIEVGGVGLRVQCTPDTLATLKPGEPARVATFLVVREDSLTLFGFATEDERNVFELLQTASGVGPRLALAMLAVHSPDALRRAVAVEDVKALTMVPGDRQQGRAADHPGTEGPPRRAKRPWCRARQRAGPQGRAVLAGPGHRRPGQPRLVRPRRRGRDHRCRGRLRRAGTRRGHRAPRRPAEAVQAVIPRGTRWYVMVGSLRVPSPSPAIFCGGHPHTPSWYVMVGTLRVPSRRRQYLVGDTRTSPFPVPPMSARTA